MRVGVQAYLWSKAGSYRQSGVSNYIRHLVRGLGGLSWPGQALAYLPSQDVLEDVPAAPHLYPRVSALPLRRPSWRIFWEHSVFPLLLWQDRVDLLHATMNVAPWWTSCPVVVTIHDLAYMRYPHVHPRGRRMYLNALTRWTVRRSMAVIADSACTKREVEQLLHVADRRVTVIHLGVDPDFAPLPQEQVEEFRRRKGLPPRYVLYVGNLEPRKNLVRLVQAYARLQDPAVPLVLAGARGWGYGDLFQAVEELGLSRQVLFPGFVPREELPLWYNGAVAFVFPSLYEGFGLPPLEAMACGTPVLVSTASSLLEVVGGAGLAVPPEDVEGLSSALRQLLTDKQLRDDLSRQGLEQAKRFSWERTVQETADLYLRLLEGSRRGLEPGTDRYC